MTINATAFSKNTLAAAALGGAIGSSGEGGGVAATSHGAPQQRRPGAAVRADPATAPALERTGLARLRTDSPAMRRLAGHAGAAGAAGTAAGSAGTNSKDTNPGGIYVAGRQDTLINH